MITYRLSIYVERFFTERLATQLRASSHTVASYRDTFRLLLRFACDQLKRSPTDLAVAHIDADLVGRFLCFIEESRGNSARSRNARLAAIRSFFRYVSINEPQLLHHCQRILAMPSKRHEKRTIDYLSRIEMEAIVMAPDPCTWIGRRDRTLLVLALQTGLRVSELIHLAVGDVVLGAGAHVRCVGKGRKERCTPLRKDCVKFLRTWLRERNSEADTPVFVSNRGGTLSRDAVERIVRKHTAAAAKQCDSLRAKKVTPHVLRHSAAMELLQNGVDRTVIALWLGHESVETTQMYIHADIQMKERAMASTSPIKAEAGRYQPDDELLVFLESL
jgi:site-specific recombinase XerD